MSWRLTRKQLEARPDHDGAFCKYIWRCLPVRRTAGPHLPERNKSIQEGFILTNLTNLGVFYMNFYMKRLLRLTATTALTLSMGAVAFGQHYTQTNLVSNTPGVAPVTDP